MGGVGVRSRSEIVSVTGLDSGVGLRGGNPRYKVAVA